MTAAADNKLNLYSFYAKIKVMKTLKSLLCLLSASLIFSSGLFAQVDKNATENTKLVMQYFENEVYGKRIITGMMDCAWSNDIDMDKKVLADTKKHTALMGYDFMFLTKSDSRTWYRPSQIEKAKDWWNKGGLVTFCWHWLDPSTRSSKGASFRTEETKFRIPWDAEGKKLNTEDKAFTQIKRDLDTVADYLLELQEAGLVVLWRPLHEAAGNYGKYNGSGKAWFWWGDSGPEPYVALYRYMFDYFTNEKGLHNLIWIWNGQAAEWYPGDDCVDIVGYDVYDDANKHRAAESYYKNLMDWSGANKMAAISEAGYVPATESLKASSAKWLYYMIWNDDDTLADDSKKDNNNFWGGKKFNKAEDKNQNAFDTDYQIKLGDKDLNALFKKMGVSIK